ncbi:hypothetical protein [Microbispora bryophytorum]
MICLESIRDDAATLTYAQWPARKSPIVMLSRYAAISASFDG